MNEDVLKALLALGQDAAQEHLKTALKGADLPPTVSGLVLAAASEATNRAVAAIVHAIEPSHVVLKSAGTATLRVDWGEQ